MPRRPRELVDSGIYHVFNRGNNKRKIFYDNEDYHAFRAFAIEAKCKLKSHVYHYCLMHNHYHMLIRIKQASDLPKLMHKIQLGYTRYFKKRHGFLGHLFQDRYRSPRINQESYYLHCGRYIERNPVKAKLSRFSFNYRWSSAQHYCLGIPDPLVTDNILFKELGKTPRTRRKEYKTFLSMHDPYEMMIEQRVISGN